MSNDIKGHSSIKQDKSAFPTPPLFIVRDFMKAFEANNRKAYFLEERENKDRKSVV